MRTEWPYSHHTRPALTSNEQGASATQMVDIVPKPRHTVSVSNFNFKIDETISENFAVWREFSPFEQTVGNHQSYLKCRLISLFSYIPIEDGYDHPAEAIIKEALKSNKVKSLDTLRTLALDPKRVGIASDLLRCLGRISEAGDEFWRASLIGSALKSEQVQLRDAAIQTAELWGGERLIAILSEHQEKERVDWLRDYLERVIRDLAN